MIGLDIENLSLRKELEHCLSREGYLLCSGYNPKLDLLILQNSDKNSFNRIIYDKIKVILITDDKENPYIDLCYYSMLEPICIPNLIDVIDVLNIKENDCSSIAAEILLDLGVSPVVKGYAYLKDAVNLYINHRDYYIRDIYELIGLCRYTGAKNVERNIRYAIEAAFNKCRVESQEKIFKNSISPFKGKPTNMEFIYRVADLIQIRKPK